MVQFYFLSILANILAGLTLAMDYLSEKFNALVAFKDMFGKRGTKITVGLLAFIVGFLKLLIRSTGEDVPLIGDFLPAVAGLGMGAAILLEFFKERTNLPAEKVSNLEKAVITYKVPLGIAGLVISVLHFIIPGALFL